MIRIRVTTVSSCSAGTRTKSLFCSFALSLSAVGDGWNPSETVSTRNIKEMGS